LQLQNAIVPLQLTLIHSPILQLGNFEDMVKHVIASIHQFILREIVCAEAPFPDVCSNVLFAVIFYVEVAGYGVREPSISKHEVQILPMLIILNDSLWFTDTFQQFLDPV
jgi:hypothetical protein